VWRARHKSGVLAAVKVLRPGIDPTAREVLQRELTTMAQLDHPGVTWVFDVGTVPDNVGEAPGIELQPGSPWMALELAEKGPLTNNYTTMNAEAVQTLLKEVLDALAHAHARGVVHRDLKPSNVLLARDGTSRLTDFGMVLLTDEHGTRVPVGGGTPSYMAPEQIRDDRGTQGPWTDLYSLGILAWVLTTGRRPFGGDAAEVLRQHLDTPLPEYVPRRGVPEGFGGWLASLLSKEPRSRVQRAADALAALGRLGPVVPMVGGRFVPAEELPTQLAVTRPAPGVGPTLRSDGPPTLPILEASFPPMVTHPLRRTAVRSGLRLLGLRDPPLVGRRKERGRLWADLLQSLGRPRPQIHLWRGSAGVGKTRLLRWAAHAAHEQGLTEVVWGSSAGWGHMIRRTLCPAATSPEPLRAWADGRGLDPVETELLVRMAGGEDVSPADAQTGAMIMLGALAQQRPVLLVLDDAETVPDALGFVAHLAQVQGELPVIALVATHDDALAADPDLAAGWKRLTELPTARERELPPLGRGNMLQLLHAIVDMDPPLEAQLASRADGNPRFAVEVLQAWAASGRLLPGPTGFRLEGAAGTLPTSVTEATAERIERFLVDRPDAEEPLELAGLLGPDVELSVWREAAGDPPDDLLSALLVARLLVPDPAGDDQRVHIPHGRIAAVLRNRANAAGRLRPHHRRVAEVLKGRGASPGHIAPHLEGAGRPKEAGEAWLQTAVTAMRDLRSADSLLAASRANEQLGLAGLPTDAEPRLMAETVIANGNLLRGRPEEQETMLASVLSRGKEGSQSHLEALLGMGVARGWQHDQEGCRRWLGTALNVAERHDIPRGRERAMERLARFESLFGNHDIACRLTRKVIREALDEGRAQRTALLTFGRAGDLEACRRHAELASMLLEAHGRIGELAGTLNDLATMLTQGGDHAGAIVAIEASIGHARRSGSMHALSFGLGSMGLIHLRCGQIEQATTALEEARAMSADSRLNRLINAALVYPLAAMGRWRELDVAIEGACNLGTTFGEDDVPDFLAKGARYAREAGEVQRAERAEAVLEGWRRTRER